MVYPAVIKRLSDYSGQGKALLSQYSIRKKGDEACA
jgi:hypothetical protein